MVLPVSPAAAQRTRLRPRPATTRHWPGFPGTLYRPRRPTQTALYEAVQHHLETFVARVAESDPMGYGLPDWVERDFRGYLECGILAHGFARARCEGCGYERLIPLSCKSRGICPSCNARRMCEVAAHLTDHVLPHVPARQWVLSVPKRLGGLLPHPELSPLARHTLAPASPPASSAPLLCLVTSCPTPPRFQPRNAL